MKWDATQRITKQRSFQQGYKEGYQEWTVDETYLQQNLKDPYVVGFLKGREAIQKDKMKELVSGKPMPIRFKKEDKYIQWNDFMKSMQFSNLNETLAINEAAKIIANRINEDLIKND